jgi:hypothetical protein
MISQKLRNLSATFKSWASPVGFIQLTRDQALTMALVIEGLADQAAGLEGAPVPPGAMAGELAPNVVRFSDYAGAPRLAPKGAA